MYVTQREFFDEVEDAVTAAGMTGRLENTGGGCMVYFVQGRRGITVGINDECVCAYLDGEELGNPRVWWVPLDTPTVDIVARAASMLTAAEGVAPERPRCVARYAYALRCALENMQGAAAFDDDHGRTTDSPYRWAVREDGLPDSATLARADVLARSYIVEGTTTFCPDHGDVPTDH